jgi:hypothetical protein
MLLFELKISQKYIIVKYFQVILRIFEVVKTFDTFFRIFFPIPNKFVI